MTTLFPTADAAAKPMVLRDYQRDAVDAAWSYIRAEPGHPLIVIPTGGGKTPIIATICKQVADEWDARVLVLAHVKELLEQTVDKLGAIAPGLDVGVYSAGLGRKELGHAVTVAGIQSLYRVADDLPPFDILVVDECHLIPPGGEGMYRTVIDAVTAKTPHARVIGLTATPFRTSDGDLTGEGHLFDDVAYEVSVSDLIARGFLSPLRSKQGKRLADLTGVRKQAGEYVAADAERAMMEVGVLGASLREIDQLTKDRKSVLIFCAGVDHAREVASRLTDVTGQACGVVTGETMDFDRAALLADFKAGRLKYLANVNVLTTGFDAPNVDCVVLLRPTMSAGLYYQMVGRGFRIAEGKDDCLVLDYGGNIMRHGPVDRLVRDMADQFGKGDGTGEPPVKACPECGELVLISLMVCPDCGHEYPEPEPKEKFERTASVAGILVGQVSYEECDVHGVTYHVHTKRDAPEGHPRTMRVTYEIGLGQFVSEWVCIEHKGFAGNKAAKWWAERSVETMPTIAEDAVFFADNGELAEPIRLTLKHTAGEKYPQIHNVELGERFGERPATDDDLRYTPASDDIPF